MAVEVVVPKANAVIDMVAKDEGMVVIEVIVVIAVIGTAATVDFSLVVVAVEILSSAVEVVIGTTMIVERASLFMVREMVDRIVMDRRKTSTGTVDDAIET